MNQKSRLLALPPSVLQRIYTFALGVERVEIEADERGALLTTTSRLLRVCKQLRHDLLSVCRHGDLQLVHTVRSPAALLSLLSTTTISPIWPVRSLRCCLLEKLQGIHLTEEELWGWSDDPNISPLFRAWREAFLSLSTDATVRLVYLDLSSTFCIKREKLARLVTCLSAILRQRSGGQAKCRILGSWSIQHQTFFENSTINAIKSDVDLGGKEPNPKRETRTVYSNRRTSMHEVDDQPLDVQANLPRR